jgi:outer membrane protein
MLQIFKKNTSLLAICLLLVISATGQQKEVWSLADCVNQALSNNITVQQQILSTKSAQYDLTQSKLALLPTLNLNANNNWQTGFAINPTTNDAQENVSFRTNSLGLGGSMPLFAGFQNINNVRVKEALLKASLKDLEQSKNTITLNVCNAYLRVLQSIELYQSAIDRIQATKAQVDRQQKMFELGSSNKSRYLQLKAQLSNEELAMVNAQNTLNQAYLELWLLIEIKPEPNFSIEKPNTQSLSIEDEPRSIDDIFTLFTGKSPDIAAAELRSKSATIQQQIAKGARSPRLTLNGNLNSFYTTQSQTGVGDLRFTNSLIGAGEYNGTPIPVYTNRPIGYDTYIVTPFNTQFNRNLGSNIGINLSIPVFNGGSIQNNVQKSQIGYQSNKLSEKLTKNNVYRSIAQSYVDFKAAFKRFDANTINLEANKEAFDVSEKQFELGGLNMADYLNAKNAYIRAEADFTQAKYELVFRRKVLDFYLGKPLY